MLLSLSRCYFSHKQLTINQQSTVLPFLLVPKIVCEKLLFWTLTRQNGSRKLWSKSKMCFCLVEGGQNQVKEFVISRLVFPFLRIHHGVSVDFSGCSGCAQQLIKIHHLERGGVSFQM